MLSKWLILQRTFFGCYQSNFTVVFFSVTVFYLSCDVNVWVCLNAVNASHPFQSHHVFYVNMFASDFNITFFFEYFNYSADSLYR